MVKQEFVNFLTANNWIRVNNNLFRDPQLSVELSGDNVKMYRNGVAKCVFDFNLGDAKCVSESKLEVVKGDKTYSVPFRKDGI